MQFTSEDNTFHEPQPTDVGSERIRKRRHRIRIGICLMVALFIAIPCMYIGAEIYRSRRHHRVFDRMEMAISSLALYCPSDLTESQWAGCIGWTWQLNCNSASFPFMATSDLQRILEEFEAKIVAGPNLATIDWLWDEYDRFSSIDYQRFRPTSADNLAESVEHEKKWGSGENPLLRWQSMHEERVGKK